MTVTEPHTAIAIHACVQTYGAIGVLGEFEVLIQVLDQDEQEIQSAGFSVPLQILPRGDFAVAQVARSYEIPDHDLLDAVFAKGNQWTTSGER